ncbi:UDP-glucose:glycoprotein glucosyltransferase [Meyerozyma sp. JA9]|nr:UDP-glucose:glycoprotein glucosyltransferase [Meyerozyma sp. JA9]
MHYVSWTLVWLVAWFGFACGQLGSLEFEIKAAWKHTPFSANLIESVAAHNESWYESAVAASIGLDDDSSYDSPQLSDKAIYENIMSQLPAESKDFISFDSVYKTHSPRIAAHYRQFEEVYGGNNLKKLEKTCATDSFGAKVPFINGHPHSFLVFNDKIYCSPEDIYALQTQGSSDYTPLEIDRVVGQHTKAPVVVLYGVPGSPSTIGFLRHLMADSQAGKLRFVWRYLPATNIGDSMVGYGVQLGLSNYTAPKHTSDEISVSVLAEKSANESYYHLRDILRSPLSKLNTAAEKVKQSFYDAKDKNARLGLTKASNGIYINGAIIPKAELSVFSLVAQIKSELTRMKDLKSLGFTTTQARTLLQKFALLSAVKDAQYRKGNTIMGGNENRFRVYQEDGVIFFNDIESDKNYVDYTTDAHEAYLEQSKGLKVGQIPALRQNVHDLIFAVNPSDRRQLEVFFTLAKIILDRGIPQQIGLLPLITSEIDEAVAKAVHFLFKKGSPQESLGFLYKCLQAEKGHEEIAQLAGTIPVPPEYRVPHFAESTSRYSIDQPSVVVNGVIYELQSPGWQTAMVNQLSQDVMVLKRHLGTSSETNMKQVLYENASKLRNLRISPQDPSTIIYKQITADLVSHSITLKMKAESTTDLPGTVWLIGDYTTSRVLEQLEVLLKFIKRERRFQINMIHTGKNEGFLENLLSGIKDAQNLDTKGHKLLLENIKLASSGSSYGLISSAAQHLLERNNLPSSYPYILFNSRFFRLDTNFDLKEISLLASYDSKQRMSILKDLVGAYKDIFDSKSLMEFAPEKDKGAWFDLLSSLVTTSYYNSEYITTGDANRFDFSGLAYESSIILHSNEDEVEIVLIIDPTDPYSRKLVETVHAVKEFKSVNIKILMHASEDGAETTECVYSSIIPSARPQFNQKGMYITESPIHISGPAKVCTSLSIDAPFSWHVVPSLSSRDLDLQKFNLSEEKWAVYELKSLITDGYAKNILTGSGPTGAVLQIYDTNFHQDTAVLGSLGYFQFRTPPGIFNLQTKCLADSENCFDLLSAGSDFNSSRDVVSSVQVPVFSLNGLQITPRLQISEKKQEKSGSKLNFWSSKSVENTGEDINIFTIASGEVYEHLLSIMLASATSHTKRSVKLWLLEDFLSPKFKSALPTLASTYGFSYEYISYKWPIWLRSQQSVSRTVWGYKILFLDALFPQDLRRVIFIDADQVLRADLMELMETDLQGAPYGFVPMCESKEEMKGYQFWKEGYWAQMLQDDLKYHISALFVVDLFEFKKRRVGDRLRAHYQKLSADPKSLSNLDQDLPNNLQRHVPIYSLPSEWLWCDTWCAKEELGRAKAIDLCNDPTSTEDKIVRAKRVISEWADYNDEISRVLNERRMDYSQRPEELGDLQLTLEDDDQIEDDESDYFHDEL